MAKGAFAAVAKLDVQEDVVVVRVEAVRLAESAVDLRDAHWIVCGDDVQRKDRDVVR